MQRSTLIIGGTSGIGLATAHRLRERGDSVMVTGRSPASVVSATAALPDDVVVMRADVRSSSDTDRVITMAEERCGSLSGLFLNAGISRIAAVEDVDEALYDELFAANTKGLFFTLQTALPLLRPGASIVVTVGIGATRGLAGASVAAATKGALLAMVSCLAVELAPRGIRVNAVSPGSVATPIWSSLLDADQVERIASAIPLGRMGHPEEIAATVAFLMSDDASYITGENLVVGGGAGLLV